MWQPEAKVLWTGNPIIAREPALPWLLDGRLSETLATLEAVQEFLPEGAQIVPGHGPVTTIEAIRWNLEYLRAVRAEVEGALAAGLSVEETVEKAQLPDFQGYALFDWVHRQVNVPAAYKELSDAGGHQAGSR